MKWKSFFFEDLLYFFGWKNLKLRLSRCEIDERGDAFESSVKFSYRCYLNGKFYMIIGFFISKLHCILLDIGLLNDDDGYRDAAASRVCLQLKSISKP